MSISGIVATYGEESWVQIAKERALPSAFGQTRNLIQYHDPCSESVAEVRNDATVDATGEWILHLDADDQIAPGYVGAMERAIEQQPNATRLLFTPAVQVVRPGRTPGPPTFFRQVPLRQANWLVIGTVVHRDLFWEVGGFGDYPHGLEDFSLWSKCARVGATVVKVPDAVYRYWANPNSMHRQLWRDKGRQREEHKRVIRELDEWESARA